MKDYSNWMTVDASESEELVFDMCTKTNIRINSSSSDIQCILNDANEWQENVDKIVLIKKSIYDISAGDYFTVDGDTYIAAYEIEDRDFYNSAKVRKCQSSLRWLDADGLVREASFTYKSRARGAGIQEGTYMILPKERRIITVQLNEHTNLIQKTKRFIFDQRAWSVDALDRLEGVIHLELEEGQIAPATDSVEERICDYNGRANYSVTIVDGDNISVNNGSTAQLTVEVKNNDIVVAKDVIFSSSDESLATVSSTGVVSAIADGNATIVAKLVIEQSVQDSIAVSVTTVVQDNYSLSVAETATVNRGYSKTFNAVVKNNGTVVTGRQIQWSLFADDEINSTTDAAITSFNDTSCVIRGDALGYVKLKMVLVGEANVFTFIRIQVKSLL